MSTALATGHRKLLEKVTDTARVLAESACRAALENLAVHEGEYRAHMDMEQRLLRNRLRARGRALGDVRDARTGCQDIQHLSELAAYEHWHRLLFTRFLTENHLLLTDEANGSVPVTLEECEELAPELQARDGLDLACRFASRTLPGVFRRDDPVLDLPLALNDQVELRKLLATLPSEVFRADDALGWTYQFWQAQRKKEVNDSGKKIGADEISPVTQLFTEDYMVEFLLHNTLGAWWAGKMGAITAATEQEARAQAALTAREGVPAISWAYLRFVQDETTKTWSPAAGTFDAWPQSASRICLLDPCMGSGHFLVFVLPLLVRLRMEEEQLSAPAAVVAVLKDNVHGLELDERCTQIAAFNVALTAWKLAGYQALPSLNMACSGLAPSATEAEWRQLAMGRHNLRLALEWMYAVFQEAPVLGSLLNPAKTDAARLVQWEELSSTLEQAFSQEQPDEQHEAGVVAQGLAKAAQLLARQYHWVITNVPYLARGKQSDTLRDFCDKHYPAAKNDLATVFLDRCLQLCVDRGSVSLVLPQNWLFLTSYRKFREKLLQDDTWHLLARLGAKAFQTPMWDFNVLLITLSRGQSRSGVSPLFHASKSRDGSSTIVGLDVSALRTAAEKAAQLITAEMQSLEQAKQLENPDARVTLEEANETALLERYATSYEGLTTGDIARFVFSFWEIFNFSNVWKQFIGSVNDPCLFGGREQIIRWENGQGSLHSFPGSYIKGQSAWGNAGLRITQMRNLAVTTYLGELFDKNAGTILPHNPVYLPAIWCFCSSPEYTEAVRRIDQKLNVTIGTLVKVPFNLDHWTNVAQEKYPNGLPKPHSDDPTQWLFNGHPAGSTQPLHVAVARLLGYRWPRQTGSSFPDCPALGPDGLESCADEDGIVCLPPLNREQPAAARLRQLLTVALGPFDERALIAAAGLKGSKSTTLEDWLSDECFEQHAKLFHDRPFLWHLWDGRRDGFHALVNYHKLDHATLQKLTYSYLGDWMRHQDEDARADKPGAAARLGAARVLQARLAAILEGEAPLDIFVRWKPLKDQAQGWHPDLNDGIRQNIRPFLLAGDVGKKGAGLFRIVPLALKDKDRGTEPSRPQRDYPWFWCAANPGTDPIGGSAYVGTRWNDVHLTLARKREARA